MTHRLVFLIALAIPFTFNAFLTEPTGAPRWKKHTIVSPMRGSINSVVASDFDKDGHIDIIATFNGHAYLFKGPNWKRTSIHKFGTGNSKRKPRPGCIHSCLLDVDQDGDMDLIGSNQTVFWLECPDEPFSGQAWKYRTVDDEILGTHCLITGDVNRDGKLDVIANSFRTKQHTPFPNSIVWLESPKNPHSDSPWKRHVFAHQDAPGGSHYMGFGDVNKDGRPDISCGAKGGPGFPGGEWFAWWEQPKDPTQPWKKHLLSDKQPGASNIHPEDVNGDGIMDFIATRGHSKGVLWFKGPKFKAIEIDPDLEGPHSLVTLDFDGDKDVDIITCGRGDKGTAVWYENNGKGQFTRHLIGKDQGSYDIRVVDMDGDKDLDVLIAGHQSKNVVWFENLK